MSSILTKPISLPRPRRPELRRPEFRRPSGGRPTLGGPELSLPSFGRKKDSAGIVTGLEIEAGSVAAVEARLDDGVPRVVAAGVGPLAPEAFRDGEVTEPEAVAEALRALFATHKMSNKVRLGIANQRLVVRTLRLPAIESPGELEAAVRFSAQEQIAMPLEEAVIEHRVVGGVPAGPEGPAQIDVMVVAARREMILTSLGPLRDAGLEPVGVDLSAFGMIRVLADADVAATAVPDVDGLPASRPATLYCNVGDATILAVARGRSCLFTRVSPVGLEDIAGGLASTTGLTLEHAGMWLNHVGLGRPVEEIEGDPTTVARTRSTLEHGAASLVDELRLSLDFYGAQEAAVPVERIVLGGPGSAIPGLAEEMEPAIGLPIAIGHSPALAGYDAVTAARLTLPLGLALDV
ncbi:MAG TPA: type IV pilus assembly protein PilM [Solirubrobacterales bacterium]|nr:type IV pilus assembly protein PilM [Solirubrobacterales bacterium]